LLLRRLSSTISLCPLAVRFRLTATATNLLPGMTGGVSYAEVTVTVNIPPFGGSFSVVPVSGDPTNAHDFTCWGWSTAHPPLRYAFSWLSSSGAETPLIGAQPSGAFTGSLPFGTTVTALAYVTDALGATTVATPVSVTSSWPPAVLSNPIGYAANLTQLLNTQLNSQNTAGSLGILTVLTGLINSNVSSPANSSSTIAIRSNIINALNQ
jgi:hypothetical protein